jgi:hypothetical protein
MIDKNLKENMDDVLSAKKYFEKLETNGGDTRESLKDVLINRFKWNKEILDKSKNPLVRLDIKGVPIIAPHPSIESAIMAAGKEDTCNTEISIYDILVPGGAICFDSASMQNAGFKSFFSKGMRAMDVANWHNFIKEGLQSTQFTKAEGPVNFKDLFDKWWLIREVGNYQVQVENFQTGIIVNFPNLIVTEPEHLLIRYPSETDKQSLLNYNKRHNINPVDLLNRMNAIFRGEAV